MNALQHIATINPIEPLIPIIQAGLADIHSIVRSYGWTMLAPAALVKLVFWPLNAMQFRSMARMQKLQPQIKALQNKYNGKDPQPQTRCLDDHNAVPFAIDQPKFVGTALVPKRPLAGRI